RVKMEKLEDSYNLMLAQLDSITGVAISLDKKTKKTPAEQQKALKIKKQQKSLEASLISMEEERMVLQENHDHLKASLNTQSKHVSDLDKQIDQLGKLRH